MNVKHQHHREPRVRAFDAQRHEEPAEPAVRDVEVREHQPRDGGGKRERQIDERINMRFPGNSYRTSTHAISNPTTALMIAAMSAAPNVSAYAARARSVHTAATN